MKKITVFLVSIFTLLLLVGCNSKMTNVTTKLDKSSYFDQKSIENAVSEMKEYSQENNGISIVNKIEFSEDYSNQQLKLYASMNDKDYNNLLKEYIVMTVDFKTSKESGSLNPEETYKEYHVLLKKTDENTWHIEHLGPFI